MKDLIEAIEKHKDKELTPFEVKLLAGLHSVQDRLNEICDALEVSDDQLHVDTCSQCKLRHPVRYLLKDNGAIICTHCALENMAQQAQRFIDTVAMKGRN